MILQRLEGHIIVGGIVSSEPSQLQTISICTWHEYNTYLFRNPILVQDISDDRSNVRSSVVPFQRCKGKLVFLQCPLIRLVNRTADIVGSN
jgi:hypothetical protein